MNKFIYNLYFISIFLLLMLGPHAWFMWIFETPGLGFLKTAMFLIVSIICFIYYKNNKFKLCMDNQVIVGLVALFVALGVSPDAWIKSLIRNILFVFPLWVIISDKKNIESLFKRIVNVLAFILLPGIIIHLYLLIGGKLPGFLVIHPYSGLYVFSNYIFLLKGAATYEEDGLRFQSIFLEPGYLGTLMAFLLYSIRYDFRRFKSGWILLVSLFLSLSMAGYVLGLLGFILFRWSQGFNIKKLMLLSVFLSLGVFFAQDYNSGRNIVNEKMLKRFELDNEKGIKGNNRVGDGANFYFERSIRDGSFLFGLGKKEIDRINGGKGWEDEADYSTQIRGAGYKIFILYNGLFSALLYALAYYKIGVERNRNKRYVIGYLIVILATFLQAAYPDSYSWLIPFILGTGINDKIIQKRKSVKVSNSPFF